MQAVKQLQATIPSGQSLSSAADTNFEQLVGLIMPAAWDAAAISFQAGQDGATFGDVFTAAGELSFPAANVAAGRVLLLDTTLTPGIRWLKVRSGLAATPVNQTAARTITLLIRDLAA